MKNTWTLKVELDEHNESCITLPDDLLELMNWTVGDTVEWVQGKDDCWILQRVS